MNKKRIVIISDMDGCLLDKTYDYRKSIDAIKYVLKNNILLILNSSKTRYEIEYYIKKWGLHDKTIFIVENGAAIFIPKKLVGKNSLIHNVLKKHRYILIDKYIIIVNGLKTSIIEQKIADIIEETKEKILWLKDFTPQKFSELTGLPIEQSILALKREYSYLFHPLVKGEIIDNIIEEIRVRGLNVSTGSGIIYLITGNHDKGLATKQIIEIIKEIFNKNIVTIGVGDGHNDISMLKTTDYSILLNCREDIIQELSNKNNIAITCRRGPSEWLNMVRRIVELIVKKQ
ncbi:mannosyl-3-phosphoglycerate phosphatase family [Staphylothermus marinus F1]|uniref:Mannosyl-3-phosphoglycerate phosphatase family n=1 Tax=Staphylothermus marinus (strain ATCC 43588 / DSM 3639 / JCM 9404 / F1) TaxID=399550 RepID=A3DLU7_STAMF|nr:HAD-IIB family hydrolase [Staphylothermus marinus]ABN69607.1 mannosyl-3-phosphoglycerate phosphatase family [Staphylothermus marinus F1]